MAAPHTNPEPKLLYAMQLRCGERKLLLPRSVVAEVKAYSEPEPLLHPVSQQILKPNYWLIGSIRHLGANLPLLQLDGLIDGEKKQPANSQHSRLCLLQCLDSKLGFPLYAVITQGFPSLMEVPRRLSETLAEKPAPQNPDAENAYIAAHIQLGAYLCAIPDLRAIESALLDYLGQV